MPRARIDIAAKTEPRSGERKIMVFLPPLGLRVPCRRSQRDHTGQQRCCYGLCSGFSLTCLLSCPVTLVKRGGDLQRGSPDNWTSLSSAYDGGTFGRIAFPGTLQTASDIRLCLLPTSLILEMAPNIAVGCAALDLFHSSKANVD